MSTALLEKPETETARWEALHRRRKALDHNQRAAGTILGVSQTTVSEWENLSRCPDIRDIPKLARYLELTNLEVMQDLCDIFLTNNI